MEKKYDIWLIFENMPLSGGNYKFLAVKEGIPPKHVMNRHDRVLDLIGDISVTGSLLLMPCYFIIDNDYELTDEQKEDYGVQNG